MSQCPERVEDPIRSSEGVEGHWGNAYSPELALHGLFQNLLEPHQIVAPREDLGVLKQARDSEELTGRQSHTPIL